MKKNYLLFMMTILLSSSSMTGIAQNDNSDEFVYLKTVDKVELYFKHSVCADTEFLILKAVNTDNVLIKFILQPSLISDNKSFQSSTLLEIEIDGNSEVIGNCDTPGLKVNIYEFFSFYDAEKITLNLIKN